MNDIDKDRSYWPGTLNSTLLAMPQPSGRCRYRIRHGKVISEAANSPPDRLGLSKSESLEAISIDFDWKYHILEHAERNAINNAWENRNDLHGSTLFSSLYPCADCARAIAAAGISRLVVPSLIEGNDRDQKWQKHYFYASEVFRLADIDVCFVD